MSFQSKLDEHEWLGETYHIAKALLAIVGVGVMLAMLSAELYPPPKAATSSAHR